MNPYDDEDTVDELPAPPRKDIPAADRELLELAARALGAEFREVEGEGYGNLHFEGGLITYGWNSLQFRGDTLELAFALRLTIEYGLGRVYAHAHGIYCDEPVDESSACLCRAVTRAAAEIGKKITG